MLTTAAIAAVLIGSSATAASSVSASSRPAPPHTATRSSRPDRADWEKIKSAARLRDLGLAPHRTAHFRSFAGFLGLSQLEMIQPLAPGRCKSALTYLYGNLLDLEDAHRGENWAPLRRFVANEPSIRACAPRRAGRTARRRPPVHRMHEGCTGARTSRRSGDPAPGVVPITQPRWSPRPDGRLPLRHALNRLEPPRPHRRYERSRRSRDVRSLENQRGDLVVMSSRDPAYDSCFDSTNGTRWARAADQRPEPGKHRRFRNRKKRSIPYIQAPLPPTTIWGRAAAVSPRDARLVLESSSGLKARRSEPAVVCQKPPVVRSGQFGDGRRSRPRTRPGLP